MAEPSVELDELENRLRLNYRTGNLITPPGSVVEWAKAVALIDIAKSLRELVNRE